MLKKKRISQIHTIQNENLMEDGNEWFGDEQRWSIKKTLSFVSSRVGYGWRFLDIIPVFLMMLSFPSFFVFFSLLIIIISITFCICNGTQQYPRPRCYRVIFDPPFYHWWCSITRLSWNYHNQSKPINYTCISLDTTRPSSYSVYCWLNGPEKVAPKPNRITDAFRKRKEGIFDPLNDR